MSPKLLSYLVIGKSNREYQNKTNIPTNRALGKASTQAISVNGHSTDDVFNRVGPLSFSVNPASFDLSVIGQVHKICVFSGGDFAQIIFNAEGLCRA